jgi:hypothetical protein
MEKISALTSDDLKDYRKRQAMIDRLIGLMYLKTQQVEAETTPATWKPHSIWIPFGLTSPRQILSTDPSRASFSIFNNGPSDILLSNQAFDVAGLTALYMEAAENIDVAIFPLLNGQNLQNVTTISGLYAVSLGNGAGNITSAHVAISEMRYTSKSQTMSDNTPGMLVPANGKDAVMPTPHVGMGSMWRQEGPLSPKLYPKGGDQNAPYDQSEQNVKDHQSNQAYQGPK